MPAWRGGAYTSCWVDQGNSKQKGVLVGAPEGLCELGVPWPGPRGYVALLFFMSASHACDQCGLRALSLGVKESGCGPCGLLGVVEAVETQLPTGPANPPRAWALQLISGASWGCGCRGRCWEGSQQGGGQVLGAAATLSVSRKSGAFSARLPLCPSPGSCVPVLTLTSSLCVGQRWKDSDTGLGAGVQSHTKTP